MLSKDASQIDNTSDDDVSLARNNLFNAGMLDSLGELLGDVLKSTGVLGKKEETEAPSTSRRKTPAPEAPAPKAGSKSDKGDKGEKPAPEPKTKPADPPASQDRATPKPDAGSRVVTSKTLASALYFYQAIVREVYDGDTITVDLDLGMRNWVHGERLRLLRINAPEYKGESHAAGEKSRDFLRKLILDKPIVVETFKDDQEKYGRYLAEIWVEDPKNKDRYINVNDLMVKSGHAKYQQY
ncbi:MAG: thermonuclease family protein [Anaerolineae bacterium]|nr:thermonuclease family protein [Anaerolineae bacterium]